MSEESEFEWVTNPSQFAPPPPLRKKKVEHPDIRHTNGKVARFYLAEMSQYAWDEYTTSLRVQKQDGSWTIADNQNSRVIGRCAQDANGNRIWPTDEAAIEYWGRHGKATIDDLVAIVDELHEPRARAEGKASSGTTPSESSPASSPSTSENPTSTVS
jgi:hypothetical protein